MPFLKYMQLLKGTTTMQIMVNARQIKFNYTLNVAEICFQIASGRGSET